MTGAGAALTGEVAALALAGLGVLCLRAAWRGRRPVAFTLAGWAAIAAAAPAWSLATGADTALALALLTPSLLALPVLAAGAKIRRGRAARAPRAEVELAEPDPNARGGARLDTLVRTALGGPIAGVAALALAAAFARHAPVSPEGRVVFAFLLAPLLWALGLMEATTDPSLRRASALLAAALVAGLVVARL